MSAKKRNVYGIVAALLLSAFLAACDVSSVGVATTPAAGVTPIQGGIVTNPNANGGVPAGVGRQAVAGSDYQGCPSGGDGGDQELNIRKNRMDSANWYPVSLSAILNLTWPQDIQQKRRSSWSASDNSAIAQYEGTPVQIEGWLAGAQQEGPESPNCHSADDVDNHLWVVDSPNKSRAQSVVAEITPRMRAVHPGWAYQRVKPLVDGATKVRISGWLMMDQEHPDQIGKTRGTIWEVHPIISFEVLRGSNWISLDTGGVVTSNSNTAPTEDPSLPPPLTEAPPPNYNTPTPRPAQGSSQGQGQSTGAVAITDIFFNGVKGSQEPDEYVQISNRGSDAVAMNGWVLRDLYGNQQFTWDSFTIKPGQVIRVYTNEVHTNFGGFSFESGQAIWANKGDAAELDDATGAVVSTFAYGNRQ